MSWTVFPRIYTNLQSNVCFQLCFQVWQPVISTKVDMLCLEKWEIITESKHSPKNGQIFQLFTFYSKGHHFSITKLDILIFCNILHLEMYFWNLSWKRIVSSQIFWQKPCEKYYKWDIEKNGIAYSTACNLTTVYLWNFHFH